MTQPIVVASGNLHKIQELQQLFRSSGLIEIELIPMTSVVGSIDIDETGSTFEENAFIKAMEIHRRTGYPVLADDSGICVDALEGAPGVRSARYAGLGATDAQNREALRSSLRERGLQESSGRFVCVLWFIDMWHSFGVEGIVEGTVYADERGTEGFGYDPMFVPTGAVQSYGQMTQEEKADTSHRARATAAMINRLRQLIQQKPSQSNVVDFDDLDLCRAAIAIVQNDTTTLQRLASSVVTSSQAVQLTEVILQSYLFAGFPAALDAFTCVAEQWKQMGLPIADVTEDYDVEHFERRGQILCKEIYGHVYERMIERFNSISPSLRSWMVIEGYGKTLSRPGLTSRQRELCIVSMLGVLQRPAQLYSHVRGACRVGGTTDDIQNVADLIAETCGGSVVRQYEQIVRTALMQ